MKLVQLRQGGSRQVVDGFQIMMRFCSERNLVDGKRRQMENKRQLREERKLERVGKE
jgi:hypothetical protein